MVTSSSRKSPAGSAAQGASPDSDPFLGLSYDQDQAVLADLCREALSHYGVRVLDNVDLGRLDSLRDKALVIGRALMERGDARAFVLARRIMAAAGE